LCHKNSAEALNRGDINKYEISIGAIDGKYASVVGTAMSMKNRIDLARNI
jgi:hypothetical protein